jgi:guanylate kinase
MMTNNQAHFKDSMRGKLVLVVAPTGSGKGMLCAYLKEKHPELIYPVSCTTRKPRKNERNGETYHFISESDFKERVAGGLFLEWASYGGYYYGTLKEEVLGPLKSGNILVHEVEVQGARILRQKIPPQNLFIIFIYAGTWDALFNRIQGREEMKKSVIALRRERYEDEMAFQNEADFVVHNSDGAQEQAKNELEEIIQAIISA